MEQWKARRDEIAYLLEEHFYGTSPKTVPAISAVKVTFSGNHLMFWGFISARFWYSCGLSCNPRGVFDVPCSTKSRVLSFKWLIFNTFPGKTALQSTVEFYRV